MQEWLNWTVSKTVVAQVTVGSNPTLSVFSLNGRIQKDLTVAKCLSFATCGAVAQLESASLARMRSRVQIPSAPYLMVVSCQSSVIG